MRIITFYNEKINNELVNYQKKVFDKLNIKIEQIYVTNWVSHGQSIDDYLKLIDDENEVIVLFDIDCIPLNSTYISECVKWAQENIGILGNSQTGQGLKPPHNEFVYVGPSYMVFSIKTYNMLGRPSFNENKRSDCGGELTRLCIDKNFKVNFLMPTDVKIKTFLLYNKIWYGYGTTYENSIFHSFESRFKKKDKIFIDKCEEILR
jgi:hypothetical protein